MHTEPQRLRISDFTYELPEHRIAVYPTAERDESKLLVFENDRISHCRFNALTDHLVAGDTLIFNQTKVIPARLLFYKSTGALIEVFCLSPAEGITEESALRSVGQCRWTCMVRGLKKWKNEVLRMQMTETDLSATLIGRGEGDTAEVLFEWNNARITFADLLTAVGELPIPPYLNRKTEPADVDRYQTVYAQTPGSVAAPTAGLHFTPNTLSRLASQGVRSESVTLHVGAGTFLPVKSETMGEHTMHAESIEITVDFMKRLAHAQGRIIAVGTTSVRSLESLYWWCSGYLNNKWMPAEVGQWDWVSGEQTDFQELIGNAAKQLDEANIAKIRFKTRLIITPGYSFRIVNGLITNFHQPGSTLLLLVAAFVGEAWRDIYSYALRNEFRFLSFGDSSLLLPGPKPK